MWRWLRNRTSSRSARLEHQYWDGLDAGKRAISLEGDAEPDAVDFHLYGMRLANRMVAYFEEYGAQPVERASILEIGCGIGRFVLPLACRFTHVYGVDVSAEIIAQARDYCRSVPNVTLSTNDGASLAEFGDGSVDYALCGGVFQHIHQFEVIAGYIREAVRILADDGLFLFTFQVWQAEDEGDGLRGARITAGRLDDVVAGLPVEIAALTTDPDDPIPHFLAVLRKMASPGATSFAAFPLEQRALRTGTFEDLPSRSDLVEHWKRPQRPVTFYD